MTRTTTATIARTTPTATRCAAAAVRFAVLVAVAGALAAPAHVRAQTPVVSCPAEATLVDLTDRFFLDGPGAPNDDGTYLYELPDDLFPGGIPFGGANRQRIFVNINGNLSFESPDPNFTPGAIPGLDQPTIAPFYADIDLRDSVGAGENPGVVTLCADTDNQRVLVTWRRVYHFDADEAEDYDHVNTFQVELADAGVVCTEGGRDIEGLDVSFRYERLEWMVGQQSGGNASGLCPPGAAIPAQCVPAAAGFDSGDGATAFAVPGSRRADVIESFLEGSNVDQPGLWQWQLAGTALPACGNGRRDPCEVCDEGGNAATCDEDCTLPECGDGIFNPAADEACDGGDSGDPNCTQNCVWLGCGNGVVDTIHGEACDDGNDASGDGCSDACEVEPGYTCDDGNPSVCTTPELPDADDDGVPDDADNCVDTPNTDQSDVDGDGQGDECDGDIDGDTIPNVDDEKPFDPTQQLTGGACSTAPTAGRSVAPWLLLGAALAFASLRRGPRPTRRR
jgi:cysteine-rich repeat protein